MKLPLKVGHCYEMPRGVIQVTIQRMSSLALVAVIQLLLSISPSFAQENSGLPIVKQLHVETRGKPTGTLIVSDQPVAIAEEGYVVFFMIRSSSGSGLHGLSSGSRLEEISLAGGSKASVSFSVSAHTKYELLSYVRYCIANCSNLSLPRDECRAAFVLKANQTLYAKRKWNFRGNLFPRCDLVFSPQP